MAKIERWRQIEMSKIQVYKDRLKDAPDTKWVDYYLGNIVEITKFMPGGMSECKIVKAKIGNGHFVGDTIITPTTSLREANEEDWLLVEKPVSKAVKKARAKALEQSDPIHDAPADESDDHSDEEDDEAPSAYDAEEELIELIDD